MKLNLDKKYSTVKRTTADFQFENTNHIRVTGAARHLCATGAIPLPLSWTLLFVKLLGHLGGKTSIPEKPMHKKLHYTLP